MLKITQVLKPELTLSPMQIQIIKMLELPSLELEERIRQELTDNPALVENKEADEDSLAEDNVWDEKVEKSEDKEKNELLELAWSDSDTYEEGYNDSYVDKAQFSGFSNSNEVGFKELSTNDSFIDILENQLDTMLLDDKLKTAAEYVIGSLDPDGYLRREDYQLVDDMLMFYGVAIEDEEMHQAVKIVQSLDPAGVAAHNLQECLLLQVQNLDKTPDVEIATKILKDSFELLTRASFNTIAKKLSLELDDIRPAIELIKHLNPKPGNSYGTAAETLNQTISPDFKVEFNDDKLSVELITENIPELRVRRDFNDMLNDYYGNVKNQTKKNKDAIQFVKQKIDSARWFIDAIKQRNHTLLLTMQTIVEMQKDFFLTGDDCSLRPMKLKDIADIVEFDVSTISRVSNSKYVDTEWGILPLKYFFSETMSTTSGDEVSAKEIKQIIKETIQSEDKMNPIGDDQLTEHLNNLGYVVARRTVAKYRAKLNIPVARLRKNKI